MKIFFDARYIRTDYHDGISRFSTELGSALAKLTPITFLIFDKDQINFLPKNAKCIKINSPTSILEPFTALILNKYHPDIVFSPMQTMGSFGRKFKLILTLHDLIYYHHRTPPLQFNPFIRAGWWLFHATYLPQRLLLNSADIVATVSEISKKEILKIKLTKRPVVVIPNAPQRLRDFLNHDVDTNVQPENLVYMGSFMPYKNTETLIRGMKLLPNQTLHLLSRISPKRQAKLKSLIPANAKVIFYNGISDKEYAKLLANRSLLVTASLDEGYGLPIAEASTLGVPAVVSDMPIFHEVAGDGALYFPANDYRAFVKQIQFASKISNYKDLSQKGVEQSKKFSWAKSANILLNNIDILTSK
jgi:glycosyltransferase involved in cell wall biosynthesis